jgi:hypothetical protein
MKNSLIDNNGVQVPQNKNPKTKLEILANQGIFKLNFPVVFLENTAYLQDFRCLYCDCYFTEQDINQNNYSL